MASKAEYVAAAKALAEIAEGYLAKVPDEFRSFVPSDDEIGRVINDAAVKAVDAAEAARHAQGGTEVVKTAADAAKEAGAS